MTATGHEPKGCVVMDDGTTGYPKRGVLLASLCSLPLSRVRVDSMEIDGGE